jgi:hypothetical protein
MGLSARGWSGVGLDTSEQVAQGLERPRVRSVNLGLLDCPEKAAAAGHGFRKEWNDSLGVDCCRKSREVESDDPSECNRASAQQQAHTL